MVPSLFADRCRRQRADHRDIDGKTQALDLKPDDRKTGATFDRFGFFDMQSGGHNVYLYADDLSYTKTSSKK